ncbi:hypothetical protein B0H63DRAFT_16714 [Podospora didyma]|uniref:Uncharacterized protein n=1 Tax=Podospora didyma TaxID=330526 RepID=A0AAE0P5J0_9PEZI|nr:hypothetical protein B0H63DRAFT_16714 [Podospora didyma]
MGRGGQFRSRHFVTGVSIYCQKKQMKLQSDIVAQVRPCPLSSLSFKPLISLWRPLLTLGPLVDATSASTDDSHLDAVVSRMKSISANVRFVALSETAPNSGDIATWAWSNRTNPQLPAHRYTFSGEFRPVQIQDFVHAFDVKTNDFQFDKSERRRWSQEKDIHRKPPTFLFL